MRTIVLILLTSLLAACSSPRGEKAQISDQYKQIFDVAYTPDTLHRCRGWFTDAGSWMGFTLPEENLWVNGFCGPFSLDMLSRRWMARSVAEVTFAEDQQLAFEPDSVCYQPGQLYLKAHNERGSIEQHLLFANATTALLTIKSGANEQLLVRSNTLHPEVTLRREQQSVIILHPSGENVVVTFPHDATVTLADHDYQAIIPARADENLTLAISFYPTLHELDATGSAVQSLLAHPQKAIAETKARWEGYLRCVMRDDMPDAYDRVAAKAVTTLISNWRTHRGGLLHEGIIPSHAVGYFVGYWAWDSWRFCVAAARFFPELAKNNMRAMFDYQQPDGMIIDCIYTDPAENNARDSKPPLACWAVDEIFTQTGDTAFVAEMYPQLMAYYKWWYAYRDHDHNGMCEYGATDGTLEAAAWESGMDNAIRFDDAKMLKNEPMPNAWSMDRESVDLNAYLALECRLLKKFATLLGQTFDGPDYADQVADYFFDTDQGFFFDRLIGKKQFVAEPGCEAYTALWTGIAKPEQVERMLPILQDTARFSTYIPFPTIAADNPKYNPRGYWRGPIWLDQTYFAIHGLRAYGYKDLADAYTRQVFDRLQGLIEGAPIHENYDTHTGARLKAPHFSWSAVHLLLLYEEYGK